MTDASPKSRLEQIKSSLQKGEIVQSVTVREFIPWFNAERRSSLVRWQIRQHLKEVKLRTTPNFMDAYIDSPISFELVEPQNNESPSSEPSLANDSQDTSLIAGSLSDPAFRIGRLESANKKPLSVKPDSSINEAVTLMLMYNYSQLPVMTNEREVKGIIGWEGIGSHLTLGKPVSFVRECMKSHYEVNLNDSLFRVIGRIIEHSYVLVRNESKIITGIVTTADLSSVVRTILVAFRN
jgi:hypothetical protein